MGYALVPLVRPSSVRGRVQARRPFGYNVTALNFVVLDPGDKTQASSGLCLAWLQNDIVDARVIKIADAADEALSLSARDALAQRLGDRGFDGRAFNLQIANLLKAPTGLPIRALRPTTAGEYVIWLGPGGRGRNRFHTQRVVPERHSKYFVDTFNRANGALASSALSNGSASWSAGTSAEWNIESNVAVETDGFTNTREKAIVGTQCDTDSEFSRATLSTYTRPAADFLGAHLYACADVVFDSGYQFEISNENGASKRGLYGVSAEAELDSDTTSSTSGVMLLLRDGSSVEARLDGTSILGPVTDTAEPSGAGNRYVGFASFYVGAEVGTRSIGFDSFDGGDVHPMHPFASVVFMQRGRFH